MGQSPSQTFPAGTFSSNPPDIEVTPYTVRRHPDFASGVMPLPPDMPNAQAFYLQSVQKYPQNDYIGCRKVINGQRAKEFTFMKYSEAFKISTNFASGLHLHGVQNADMVCIYSENRPEWILSMDASYLLGYVTVALYDTFATDALEFSINNCNAKYIIASKKNFLRLLSVSDQTLAQFKLIILFDPIDESDSQQTNGAARVKSLGVDIQTFDSLCHEGEGKTVEYPKIDPEQLLYICYSSGTTGFPKGVMISHRSFITNLLGIEREGTDITFSRHLSYLPLCHVFERMCTSCALLHGGCIGTFSGDPRKLAEDLASLKPTVMIVVPRVLSRICDLIETKVNNSPFILRWLFNGFYQVKKYLLGHEMSTAIPDAIVFNKIKCIMGGSITQIVNGGAALPVALHERMQNILGCPIRPGYGLSEGGSGNTLNPFTIKYIKYGTSGYPLANVELKIEKVPDFNEPGEGEILMGGSGLCSGYLNDKDATDALFTDETHTWIHTGDIGKFDSDNALVVVDRLRSIFKLAQGEYVAGDLLATFFEKAELVEQIFVYGDSTRNYLVGIVLPNRQNVAKFVGVEKMTDEEYAKICDSKNLNEKVMEQIEAIAKEKKLLGYQKVMKIRCVPDEWTVDNGCISPTFKPKRKRLAERYHDQIEQMYI